MQCPQYGEKNSTSLVEIGAQKDVVKAQETHHVPFFVDELKSSGVSCLNSAAAVPTGRQEVTAKRNEARIRDEGNEENRNMTRKLDGGLGNHEMETLEYPHLPPKVSTVHLALFTNVSNAANLRRRLVYAVNLPGEDGEREREAINYAFVDARLVRTLPCS